MRLARPCLGQPPRIQTSLPLPSFPSIQTERSFVSPLICCSLIDKPRKHQRLENSVYFLPSFPVHGRSAPTTSHCARDPERKVDFLKVPQQLLTGLVCNSSSTTRARDSEDFVVLTRTTSGLSQRCRRCSLCLPNSSCLGRRR